MVALYFLETIESLFLTYLDNGSAIAHGLNIITFDIFMIVLVFTIGGVLMISIEILKQSLLVAKLVTMMIIK